MVDYRKSRWRPPKPEMEIIIEQNELATQFQRPASHLRQPGLVCDTAGNARLGLVTGIQEDGHHALSITMAAVLNFSSRPTSDNVDRVTSKSGMAEIWGQKLESWRHLSLLKSYLYFRLVTDILKSGISQRRSIFGVPWTCPTSTFTL